MFFNQTLNGRIELGSYSVGKIRFFGVALDFAIEPVFFSSSPGNLSESMIGHPPVPRYQGEFVSYGRKRPHNTFASLVQCKIFVLFQ